MIAVVEIIEFCFVRRGIQYIIKKSSALDISRMYRVPRFIREAILTICDPESELIRMLEN